MEKISLLFLGTGNAIPTKLRNHTAILLTYKSENILIDCGEGTQRQFKIANVSPTKLTKILITHWHGDHILGLPGLLQTLAMSNFQTPLNLYGPKGTSYFMHNLSPFIKAYNPIKLSVNEVSGKVAETSDFIIESLPMSHGIPANAYSFIIKDKLRFDKNKLKKMKLPNSPLLKQLQQGKTISFNGKKISPKQVCYEEKGRKVTFILDTLQNENAIKIAKNSDILICESSFSNEHEKMAQEHKHLTASQAASIAKKAKVKHLILTHISQRYEQNPEMILKEARKIFKSTSLVKDFDKIEI